MGVSTVRSSKIRTDQNGEQRSYTGQNGTLYYTEVELEDGTKGEVGSKTPGIKWQQGDAVQYTFTPNANPKYLGKLKLEKPKDGSYSGVGGAQHTGGRPQQQQSARTFDTVGVEVGHAVTNAVTILSIGAKVAPTPEAIKEKAREILKLSDELKAERRAQQGEPKASPAPAQQTSAKPVLTQELADKFIERVKRGDATANMESLTSYYDVPKELLRDIATAILLTQNAAAPAPANVPDGVDSLPF